MVLRDIENKLPGNEIGTIEEHTFSAHDVVWSVTDWEGNALSIKVPLRLISRDDALFLLKDGAPGRLRNYEIEQELHERVDMGYFIPDVCPINGFSIYKPPQKTVDR